MGVRLENPRKPCGQLFCRADEVQRCVLTWEDTDDGRDFNPDIRDLHEAFEITNEEFSDGLLVEHLPSCGQLVITCIHPMCELEQGSVLRIVEY